MPLTLNLGQRLAVEYRTTQPHNFAFGLHYELVLSRSLYCTLPAVQSLARIRFRRPNDAIC